AGPAATSTASRCPIRSTATRSRRTFPRASSPSASPSRRRRRGGGSRSDRKDGERAGPAPALGRLLNPREGSMSVEHLCQRHGRPAVATRTRLRPDGTQEVEYLCEIDLAEERMANRFGGRGSLFDDFFSDFFGDRPSSGQVAAPSRQVERVDVTQFFSDATRELLQRAAQTALEWGSLDLDSDHLLHAALQDDVVRHVLRQADADPEAIAAQLEEEADQVERTDVAPSLSPDAKAALLAAYEESRELGA